MQSFSIIYYFNPHHRRTVRRHIIPKEPSLFSVVYIASHDTTNSYRSLSAFLKFTKQQQKKPDAMWHAMCAYIQNKENFSSLIITQHIVYKLYILFNILSV